MESERPHRTKSNSSNNSGTSTTTSELFICFSTSRLSSSSMKLTSKSILSPGRARDSSQISLSSSLSRRLRTSGSIKGGQASPMFPSNGGSNKKRGCAFENPEPSSPKVTCIGQVRVKTKKQGKKMRIITRSKRRGSEASFRKTGEQSQQSSNTASQSQELYNFQNHQISNNNQQECLRQRNQRWVHLPLTICEALRAFGSEFNCLLPNRSSCLASEDNNNEKKEENKGVRSESGGSSSSCGAVFARWFVALQDGEGKGREIELVVGEDQEKTERSCNSSSSHSQRRQVFEGIEFKEEIFNEGGMEEEEGGRVSICVPPKNALLLMRCRSDPVKMAALANKFWETPAAPPKDEDENDEGLKEEAKVFVEEKDEEIVEKVEIGLEEEVVKDFGVCEKWVCDGEDNGDLEEVENLVFEEVEVEKEGLDENPEKRQQLYDEVKEMEEKAECQVEEEEKEEELDVTQQALPEDCCLLEVFVDPESLELQEEDNELCEATGEEEKEQEEEKQVIETELPLCNLESVQSEQENDEQGKEEKAEAEVAEESKEEEKGTVTEDRPKPEPENPNTHLDSGSKRAGENPVLPDCLLLMMCEPKLSMEVSKETWVCSTDFIRCLPERHVKKIDGPDEAKKRVTIESNHGAAAAAAQPVIQPPRSSCSFPVQAGPVSMATVIGQKLVGSSAYEPFVLTRCKSEPMRSASKLGAPETCFWKNRKLEPHRQAAMGVGAAGVGF